MEIERRGTSQRKAGFANLWGPQTREYQSGIWGGSLPIVSKSRRDETKTTNWQIRAETALYEFKILEAFIVV